MYWAEDGSAGVAKGTPGWMSRPGTPSTIDFAEDGHRWFRPRWPERWSYDGFIPAMGQLLQAVALGADLEISGKDNLRIMALVDAAYESVRARCAVVPALT